MLKKMCKVGGAVKLLYFFSSFVKGSTHQGNQGHPERHSSGNMNGTYDWLSFLVVACSLLAAQCNAHSVLLNTMMQNRVCLV